MSRVRKLFGKRVQEELKMRDWQEEISKFENEYLQEPLSKDAVLKDQKSTIQKLQLENNVLKEQLKLAESQINDLKQQVDELNKAVYQENGED